MKKIILISLLLTLATSLHAQVINWNNNAVFMGAKLCWEALPANGNAVDSASYDVCLVRTAANAVKFTGADGSTAAALTASTYTGTAATFTATASLTLGTAGSTVGQAIFNNATSGTITVAPPTGALGSAVVTLPALTGSLVTGTTCGASLAAAGACPNTSLGATGHFFAGSFLLSGSTSTVTGISPAFTSATSWWCVANDVTTRANPVQAIPGSGSTLVITNTTGATDLIQVICAGN
jgi:hypothetical protein